MTVLRYHDEPITITQFPILAKQYCYSGPEDTVVEQISFGENMTENEAFVQS